MTDRLEAVARAIAYHMASVVARNNQPHMSGDPRERVPASLRREFDDGCLEAARAAIAALDAGDEKLREALRFYACDCVQPLCEAESDESVICGYTARAALGEDRT